MARSTTLTRRRLPSRRGFSLIEASIAVLLTGLLIVAALRSLGASRRRESATADQVRGRQIASDLMNEILRQAYQEPSGAVLFGPESGETASGNRSLFDDVDDYRGWTSSPPSDRNGTPLAGFTGWSRNVAVDWADPTTLDPTSTTNTGLKRITVTVAKGTQTVATVVGYRSVAWADTIPKPTDATDNHPPVAVATGTNLFGFRSTTASFNATGSSDQDGDVLSYVWNFGDGSTGNGATISHLYNSRGVFTCTLTVYDGRGGVSADSLIVIVF